MLEEQIKNFSQVYDNFFSGAFLETTKTKTTWGVPIVKVEIFFEESAEYLFTIDTISKNYSITTNKLLSNQPHALDNFFIEYVVNRVVEISESFFAQPAQSEPSEENFDTEEFEETDIEPIEE